MPTEPPPTVSITASDEAVQARQLQLLATSLRNGCSAGLLAVPLLGLALFRGAWPAGFLALYALLATLLLAGVVLSLQLLRRPPPPAASGLWLRRLTWHSGLYGLGWGLLVALQVDGDALRTFMLLCGLALVQVSIHTGNIAHLPSNLAFALPSLVPFVLAALAAGGPVNLAAAGGMTLVVAVLLFNSRQATQVMLDSIRMRFENAALDEALTEQRVRERTAVIAAASRQKSAFLASTSQALRPPLNLILGHSQMLQDDARALGATALVPDLQAMHAAGRELLLTLNTMLDLSRIEAGRLAVQIEPVALDGLCEALQASMAPLAARQGNRLRLELAPGLPPLPTDAAHLQQLLLQLLGNACKYTHEGLVTLAVRRQPLAPFALTQAGGAEAVFEVRDSGIGLAPEALDALLQDGADAGPGLGLPLARRLARLLGGTLTASSQPGRGSCFVLRLPWPAVADPAAG